MKSITKRIMESTVVLALLVSLAIVWFEKKNEERIRQQCPAILKMYNQAIWEKYKPGNRTAYLELLQNSYNSQHDDIYDFPFTEGRPHNFANGLAAIDWAPAWFFQKLDVLGNFSQNVHQVLNTGPMISSPEETQFLPMDSDYVDSFLRGIPYAALRDWLRGEKEKAIGQLMDLIHLGQAFRFSPVSQERNEMRTSTIQRALVGFNSLIWNNLDVQSSRTILHELKAVKPETWIEPQLLSDFVWLLLTNSLDEDIPVEKIAAYRLLNGFSDLESDEMVNFFGLGTYRKQVKEALLVDRKTAWPLVAAFERKVAAQLGKWTTVPAVNKRLDKLPDDFFADDFFLTPEQARSLPRSIFAITKKSKKQVEDYERKQRSDEISYQAIQKPKLQALALQSAFWCRVWREDHGAWPTAEEFKTQSPAGESLALFKIENSKPFLLDYQRLFEERPRHSYSRYDRPIKVDNPNPRTLRYTYFQYGENPGNPTQQEKQKIEWTKGIFLAACPLVQSVTYTITSIWSIDDMIFEQTDLPLPRNLWEGFRVDYSIEMSLPQFSYWIAEWKDETGQPEEFLNENLQPEKPNNEYYDSGENPEKPVIQLAGWE